MTAVVRKYPYEETDYNKYYLLQGKPITEGAGDKTVYGIEVVTCKSKVLTYSRVEDISSKKDLVQKLLIKIKYCGVDADRLKMVVEDHLEEISQDV